MKAFLSLCIALALPLIAAAERPVRDLPEAPVLPLALSDAFEFRKVKTFLNDPDVLQPTGNKMLQFERNRVNFGAVTSYDQQQRRGHYYTFFWRANRQADLTVRFEYRQSLLGPFVLAKEVDVPNARGSHQTDFEVIGDEYREDGRVTQWRALLIENGQIVGLTQSHLWH